MSAFVKASLLFLSLLVCASALVVTQQLRRDRPAPVPRDLFAAVNQQLSAFRAADFSRAYQQAANGVQRKFTPAQFETMVRREYPEMTRNQRVEFGIVNTDGANVLVQVFFISPEGNARSFTFSLVYEDETWKIDGVAELPPSRRAQPLAGTHA
jgi:hypothetical protein